jgi:histidinol dehydrogenase
MGVIPAKVAGVQNIIVCSPKIKPSTVVAADLSGANEIFSIGGVQAIAAMAYGTKSIPKVDKVVGPGNIYVTLAKKEIFGDCGIDMLAGPSEILIVADKYANPKFVAADILAQAEHDVEAKTFFISDSKNLIDQVEEELKRQLERVKTKGIIVKSLARKRFIKVKNITEAIIMANDIAPEHLELQIKNPKRYLDKIKNCGSLFLGEYSAAAFGDYCSGTNHILPTGKTAKFTGGLSVRDFIKIITYQHITKDGAKKLSRIAKKIADIEGLDAHKKSIEIRL